MPTTEMNKKEIEELIKFVSKAGVSEVSLELKDFKLTVKNNQPVKEQVIVTTAPAIVAAPPVAAPMVPPTHLSAAPKLPTEAEQASADEAKYIQVKSPMVGTFYRASTPEKPNFINVGDEVKPGKVVCIIEAMKLFNEIESEVSGRIVKVLVDNASPVEYDQPLFLVDPS